MKNLKLFLLTVLISISISVFALEKSEKTISPQDSILLKKREYYCPMHPDEKANMLRNDIDVALH
jgi:hypothetical protein